MTKNLNEQLIQGMYIMSTNNAVNVTLSGQTGTVNFVGSTSPTLVTPTLGVATATSLKFSGNNGIIDSNGNEMIALSPTSSAVNYFQVTNAATNNPPILGAVGSDSNIVLEFQGKGTSGCAIQGTTAGGNAAAGYVGEYISATNSGSTVTSGVASDITSISLTAGDWDVNGNIFGVGSGSTTFVSAWTSTTSASAPVAPLFNEISIAGGFAFGINAPYNRLSISSTTTVYLSGTISGVGTMTAYGKIQARRVR